MKRTKIKIIPTNLEKKIIRLLARLAWYLEAIITTRRLIKEEQLESYFLYKFDTNYRDLVYNYIGHKVYQLESKRTRYTMEEKRIVELIKQLLNG
jgi:hypothetical protein